MSENLEIVGEKAFIPKPSGIKPPVSAIAKVSRICGDHEKKPDLPKSPQKTSE